MEIYAHCTVPCLYVIVNRRVTKEAFGWRGGLHVPYLGTYRRYWAKKEAIAVLYGIIH